MSIRSDFRRYDYDKYMDRMQKQSGFSSEELLQNGVCCTNLEGSESIHFSNRSAGSDYLALGRSRYAKNRYNGFDETSVSLGRGTGKEI
jgi:hypothetical protein